jgi:hypothetical protein
MDLRIPLLGPVIQGYKTALQVAEWLQPQVMLPTAAGGDVVFAGVLNSVLQAKGNADELRAALHENHLSTQVLEAKPGDRIELTLKERVPH